MKVSSRVNELIKKHSNINIESFINGEDQYSNEIKSKINGTNDIILEAKRLILQEQIEKIIDINLCNIENDRNNKNDLQITTNITEIKTTNHIFENLIKIKNRFSTQDNKTKTNPSKNKFIDYEIARKCFKKWKETTDFNKADHIDAKYDNFFEELEKRQKTLSTKDDDKINSAAVKLINIKTYKDKYENRYNAQAKTILTQKYKLLEQEKEIEELKYGKVRDELLKSLQEHKQELCEMSTKVSIKTKCKLGVITKDKQQSINVDAVKPPKGFREMEKRAQERELRREQIKERKRLIEEERRRILIEAAENKRIQDEEEKRRNLEAIKERRKKEMEIEKRKREERLKQEEINRLADHFYKRSLKIKVVKIFKRVLVLKEENEYKSLMFYEISLEKRVFLGWKRKVRHVVLKRNFKADDLWRSKCLRRSFEALKKNYVRYKQDKQVAEDFYNFSLTKRIFRSFHVVVCREKMRRYKFCIKAAHHYNSRILLQYFYLWKSLPIVLQLERAKEEKKRKWREKVMEILPDYKPISYDDDY